MAKEYTVLFELSGSLQRRDESTPKPGKFSVVDKRDGPMHYAGRWKENDGNSATSLGFSASNAVAEVLFAAMDQGFIPSGINLNLDMLVGMTDAQLRELLLKNGISLNSSW